MRDRNLEAIADALTGVAVCRVPMRDRNLRSRHALANVSWVCRVPMRDRNMAFAFCSRVSNGTFVEYL